MAKEGIRIKFHRVRKVNGLEIAKPDSGRYSSRPEIHVILNTRRHEARIEQQADGDAKVSIHKKRGGEDKAVHTVVCDTVEMVPMDTEENESDQ